ncbi:MAG TPA: hypothetical protein VMH05_18510 [Bryobacteraceae bacterium]|nr:hypothetical protein [Bryobacteraceae bacterium]
MRQSQSGFVDPSRVSGFAPASDSAFEQAVSFRFLVTWSSLLRGADAPRPTQASPLVPAPRLMPSLTQAMPLSASARTYADEVAPGAIKKGRPAAGFQWEMVVPKMVRTAKKATTPNSPRPVTTDSTVTSRPAPEPSAPNLYTAASGFRKSFSFRLCVAVGVLAVISVPLWKHAARPAASEIETSVAGGDWLRESAAAGDPGVKQSRQLVLYKPALKAANCRFEFDWTTASGDVGLVFRAKDLGNYYAVRLKVLKAGPNPTFSAEYFSVYQFVEGPHNEKILVFSRNDPVVHVRMDVFGPMFTLYLQNNATEYWTDAQLASGAVGFLEEWNRGAEIRGVRISFPQNSRVLHAPLVPGMRQFLAMNSSRVLAGARDKASGGV